jgi:CDP-diacylglycerol--glycerol-3-phosphate 3-phosphatidyltransferase
VVLFTVALVALGAALLTSYIRAKAESLGWTATVGLLERPERVIILIVGIGLGLLPFALWVLAVGGTVTVAQRLRVVRRQAAQG